MIILNEFVDFIKVIGIEMIAFYAEISLDRFGKELRFISIGLGIPIGTTCILYCGLSPDPLWVWL